MESLEDLIVRIKHYRQDGIPNLHKIVFGVTPAVELGIENLAAKIEEIDTRGSTPIESLHIINQFLISDDEIALSEKVEKILPLAEELNDAVNKARSLSTVEHMFAKLGEPIKPFLTERREIVQKADDYLDDAELFVNSLIELSDQIK